MGGDLIGWGMRRGFDSENNFLDCFKLVIYILYGVCFELKEE